MYRPASVRRRITARLVDWVLYVIVGLGLVLVVILGLRLLEAKFVAIGDEGLVEDVEHITIPGVEQDHTVDVERIIEEYETRISRDLDWWRFVADDMGVSLEEAIETYAWQTPMSSLVHEIRVEFPDDFSGAEITDDVTGWIGFKSGAPLAAGEAIRAFSRSVKPIEIVEHRGFSEKEVLDRRHQVRRRQPSFGIRDHPESLESVEQAIIALLSLPPPLAIVLFLQMTLIGSSLTFLAEIPLTAIGGQTVGKTLARVRVVRVDDTAHPGFGRSLARWFVLYGSLSIPLVGVLLFTLMIVSPLFDSSRRGWHDKVAGTIVIRDPHLRTSSGS